MKNKIEYHTVDLSGKEVLVFINGIKAENLKGFLWMWMNLIRIYRSVRKHKGSFDCLAGLISPFQIVMVSYWNSPDQLGDYYRGSFHRKFAGFIEKNPKALSMFFEKYTAQHSGKYVNGYFGLRKMEC